MYEYKENAIQSTGKKGKETKAHQVSLKTRSLSANNRIKKSNSKNIIIKINKTKINIAIKLQ